MKTLKNIFIILLLLSVSAVSAQSSYIFNDDFSSKGTWPSGNSEKRELKISNGKYYFSHKREKGSWSVSTEELDIDFSRDFEIETSIQKISGVDNYAFGIMFNRKDNDNMSQFSISSNGYFRVSNSKNGDFENLKKWTESSSINKGNYASNKFKIKKSGNTLYFYVNGDQVFRKNFTPFIGKRVGILVYREQKIAIDYIRVKYNSNSKKTVSKTVMYDSFYSNRNQWAISNTDDIELKIKNSKYYFSHKRDKKGWSSTLNKFINTNRNFKIEAKIEKISGIKDNGFGLIWGREDASNQNQFTITASGSYSIDKYKNGDFTAIKGWTKSSAIKKGNYATNTLTILKEGNRLKFYINDEYLFSKNFEDFYGNRIGFIVFERQKIAIDYLSISYTDEKPNTNNILVNNNTTRGDLIINEQFSNNDNEWLVNNNENTKYSVKYGKYYFKHKPDKGGYATYLSKYFNDSRDFEIETKIDKISGVTNYAYGILWGKKDNNSFRFYISSAGYYKVVRKKKGDEEKIISWTKSSYINTGNGASNTLKIRKQGEKYKFYINNSYVNQMDFEPFHGDKIGYVVFNRQEIAIDYLTVNYLKKSNNNVVTTKTISAPLFENFTSNTNGWIMEDSESYSAAIANGKLLIDKKQKGGIFVSRNIDINTNKDFIIETSLSKVRSANAGLYGITFGRKNSSNEYSFLISNSGDYMLRKFDNDKYHKLIPFTESSAINKNIGSTNKIKIVKSGNLLRFYINNQYVNEYEFGRFFGNKFGYTVFYNQKIAVDYLNIKYQSSSFNNPPVIAITSPNVEAKRGFKIVKTKKILVRGKATDKDGIYEVSINGIEAHVAEDGTFSANVPLKFGTNKLIVTATDIKQKSSTKTFTIKRKSPNVNNDDVVVVNNNDDNLDIGFGKYYALLIGISDYGDSAIPNLEGMPKKDAQDLGNVLINKYNFKRENVVILNNSPTANQIMKEFYKLKQKVTSNDNVLIFYAGHGVYDKKNEIGHWLPSDADMEYELNLISNTQVVDYLKSIKSKHTLLISDACFSGSIFKHRSFKKAPKSIQKKYELPSKKAITSGTLKTVPNKSVFLKYLLKRLNNNQNKYLPARKLFDNIEEPVMNNSPNTPQYGTIYGIGDEGGDFIFIKKK